MIYLKSVAGTLDGAFEIVSVDSATQLTVSIVRADDTGAAIPPPAGTDVTYRTATFVPQAQEAGDMVMRCFGIDAEDSENILEPDEIRQVSAFMTLSIVYATLAGDETTSEEFWKKSLHYRKLFEQMREILQLDLDTNSDGQKDEVKRGGEIRLVRE